MPQKKRKKKKQQNQGLHEVYGVCAIALGLFLGASLYFGAVGAVGKFVCDILSGLTGMFSYAAPILLAAAGIALIVTAMAPKKRGRVGLILFGVFCVLAILHISAAPVLPENGYITYIKMAYMDGSVNVQGGGAIGAILAYPAILALGTVGAYIILSAIILVVLLLVTKISLKSAGAKVGESISNTINAAGVAAKAHSQRQSEKRKERQDRDDDFLAPITFNTPKEKSKPRKLKSEANEFIPRKGPIKLKQEIDDDPFGLNEVIFGMDGTAPFIKDGASCGPIAPIQSPFDKNGQPPLSALVPQAPFVPYVKEDVVKPASLDDTILADDACVEPSVADDIESFMEIVTPPPIKKAAIIEVEDIKPVPHDAAVYQRPPFTLLNLPERAMGPSGEQTSERGKLLIETLNSFNISAKLLNVSVGPAITRYELQPAQGVRVNRITTLSDDIALALAAPRVRIEAPIPGKAAIGIEIPNTNIASVLLREIIDTQAFVNSKSSITFALGKDITGNIALGDLDKMPHLLIAGATGSGKSVCINDIIISMIYKSSPEELRLILVDPKVVELKMFSTLPHLLVPVVTEPKKAAGALKWAVAEMEQRYQKLAKANVRNLAGYNAAKGQPEERMPKLVIIIDELADLMMVAAKDVEESICRIAQLGRACGIHLIVATQRPSADIITGLIKANIPSRIAFAVSSAIDSRVIMDASGAEKLLGRGDMLFHANGAGKPMRIQGAFVSDEEVERISDFFESQSKPLEFDESIVGGIESAAIPVAAQGNGKQEDELLKDAVKIVLDNQQASISMIQRRLRVGYARAARLIDIMEQKGIVSGFDGSRPRRMLIDYVQFNEMFGEAPMAEDAEIANDGNFDPPA